MRNLLVVVAIIIGLTSCEKVKDKFDITYSFSIKQQFVLPKVSDKEVGLPDSTITIPTPNIPNPLPAEFEKNNVNINKLKSLNLESVNLIITAPVGQDFGFMKSIKIIMGADGKGEKAIAFKNNINTISPAPTQLELNVENSDIVEYIKNNTYFLKFETVINKSYTKDINIEANVKGKVVANPIR